MSSRSPSAFFSSPPLTPLFYPFSLVLSLSMKSWDPEGKLGPRHPLPDSVVLLEPKEEAPVNITSESRGVAVPAPAAQESAAPVEEYEAPAAAAEEPVAASEEPAASGETGGW